MEVQRAYRHLLRVVGKRVSLVERDPAWRDLLSAEFRKPVDGDVPARVQLAYDYAFLIDGVHEQKVCCLKCQAQLLQVNICSLKIVRKLP